MPSSQGSSCFTGKAALQRRAQHTTAGEDTGRGGRVQGGLSTARCNLTWQSAPTHPVQLSPKKVTATLRGTDAPLSVPVPVPAAAAAPVMPHARRCLAVSDARSLDGTACGGHTKAGHVGNLLYFAHTTLPCVCAAILHACVGNRVAMASEAHPNTSKINQAQRVQYQLPRRAAACSSVHAHYASARSSARSSIRSKHTLSLGRPLLCKPGLDLGNAV